MYVSTPCISVTGVFLYWASSHSEACLEPHNQPGSDVTLLLAWETFVAFLLLMVQLMEQRATSVMTELLFYSCILFSLSIYTFTCTLQFCCFALKHCQCVNLRKHNGPFFEAVGLQKCNPIRCYCVWSYTTTLPWTAVSGLSPKLLQRVLFSSRSHWQTRAITVHLNCSTHLSVSWLSLLFLIAYLLFTLMWEIM